MVLTGELAQVQHAESVEASMSVVHASNELADVVAYRAADLLDFLYYQLAGSRVDSIHILRTQDFGDSWMCRGYG